MEIVSCELWIVFWIDYTFHVGFDFIISSFQLCHATTGPQLIVIIFIWILKIF